MRALIDGDVIKYSCAHAADGSQYRLVIKSTEDYVDFKYKKDLLKFCKQHNLDEEDYVIEHFYQPEPIENCLHSVKILTSSFLKNPNLQKLGVDTLTIYLSDSRTFRHDLASILEYKANRKQQRKPAHLDACHDYLVEHWAAVQCDYIEADDAMGIGQFGDQENTVICSPDKDLDMIPGWHFNWQKDEAYKISDLEASKCFYKQLLTGDGTDNILGLYGVGPKSGLVKTVDGLECEKDMFEFVYGEYTKRFGSYAKQFLTENASLLWIMREEEKQWEWPEFEND